MLDRIAAIWKRRTSRLTQLAFVCGGDYRYDDADCLSVSYPYDGIGQLTSKLGALRIKLAQSPINAGTLDSVIPEHPSFLQPKYTDVLGAPAHVLIAGKFITVSVRARNPGHLSLAEVDTALALDKKLATLNFPRRSLPLTMPELVKLTRLPNDEA